jgi:hypothetical protein
MAILNNLGQIKLGWRTPVVAAQVVSSSLLLDTYSGAAAAYSLRKLSGSYTGNAIRVRRSSDNTEQNIGFDANGNLNTVALLSFVGSGNGFVTTWYDQSGNNKNVTQSTANSQPQIVSSGSIILKNNKPAIDFSTGQILRAESKIIGTTQNSVFNVFSIKSLSSRTVPWDIGTNNPWNFYSFDVNTWGGSGNKFGFYTCNAALDSNISTNLNQNLLTVITNNGANQNIVSNMNYYINTTKATFASSGSVYGLSNIFEGATRITLGDWNGWNLGFNGTHQEFISYPINQLTNREAIASNINSYYSIYASDTDAQAFVTAAGITDGTQINAVDTLVTDLKAAGVWTKMKALYPFVGGSANSHKFNLKDPRDLDAAYRLTFVGGWTHSSAGAYSNGTTGYANPNINANQIFTSTDGLMGIYTPLSSISGYIYGVSNMSDSEWSMWHGLGSLGFSMYRSTTITGSATLPGLSSIGMETNGHRSVYKNNSRLTSTAAGFIPMSQNLKMYLSARNANGNADAFTSGLYSFSFISSTLTLTEYAAFYTAVQKYQTTLGRQVGTPVGTSNIVTTGLILNLDANNPSSYSGTGTTWTDLTGTNNGTLVNGPTYDSTNGGSLLFDGVNDYVGVPIVNFGTSSFSTSLWLKPNRYVSSFETFIGQGSYPVNGGGIFYGAFRNDSGTRRIHFSLSSDPSAVNSKILYLDNSYTINTWINVVFTYNSSTREIVLYINGVRQSATVTTNGNFGNTSILQNVTPTNTSGRYLSIGTYDESRVGMGQYSGNIASTMIHFKQLSAAEVLQNFNATKSRFGL